MRTIDTIITHCSATPEGKNFTVEDIDRWHRQRGWKNGIGYHFVVYLDGSVHQGRPVEMVGAHCEGYNKHSIGICYIGGYAKDGKTPKDTRTHEQKAALLSLLRSLKKDYPNARIVGHRDMPRVAKACPCFDAKAEYSLLCY